MSNLNYGNYGGWYPTRSTVKKVRTTVYEYDENGNVIKETVTETEYGIDPNPWGRPYTVTYNG